MRTNIEIDDELMATAMKAGPFQTKKEAVEAGLKLLARQAAYREILKWRGKLKWEGDESIDWTRPDTELQPESVMAQEPAPRYGNSRGGTAPSPPSRRSPAAGAKAKTKVKRDAGC